MGIEVDETVDGDATGEVALLERVLQFTARGFGSGLVPVAPGTAGSLVGVALCLVLRELGPVTYAVCVAAGILVGVYLCGRAAERSGIRDDPTIVWDEIIGYCVAMIAAPDAWYWIPVAFVLFRLFDIWKPWPISWLDQHAKGGLGIMADDVAAGAASAVLVQLSALVLSRWGLS